MQTHRDAGTEAGKAPLRGAAASMAANGLANGTSSAVVAVGEARDALPAPDLSGLNLTVDSQTHAVGVIHPPPDIRAIVDKTAQFVAKNGEEAALRGVEAACAPHSAAILNGIVVRR